MERDGSPGSRGGHGKGRPEYRSRYHQDQAGNGGRRHPGHRHGQDFAGENLLRDDDLRIGRPQLVQGDPVPGGDRVHRISGHDHLEDGGDRWRRRVGYRWDVQELSGEDQLGID